MSIEVLCLERCATAYVAVGMIAQQTGMRKTLQWHFAGSALSQLNVR